MQRSWRTRTVYSSRLQRPLGCTHYPSALTVTGFGLVPLSRTKPTFKTFPSFYFISCALLKFAQTFYLSPFSYSSVSLYLSPSYWPCCSLYFHFLASFFSFFEKQLRHFAFNLAVFSLTVATATATIAQWSKAI